MLETPVHRAEMALNCSGELRSRAPRHVGRAMLKVPEHQQRKPQPHTSSTTHLSTVKSQDIEIEIRISISSPHTLQFRLSSNTEMNVDTIPDFLGSQRDDAPADLQHLYISIEDAWERKLWHQLTDTLVELFNHKESASQRLPFYKTFILTFADKINQLKLVTLALSAASQCKGM